MYYCVLVGVSRHSFFPSVRGKRLEGKGGHCGELEGEIEARKSERRLICEVTISTQK